MKIRITSLILMPIIGAILGYLLFTVLNNGWLRARWQRIEKPPANVQRLVAISKDSLWVQSDTGALYYIENSSACKTDCWREVSAIPALPVVEPDEMKVTGEACAPSLPLSRVVARISECRQQTWVDSNFTFALRKDGSLYLWQAALFKEWAVVLLFGSVCLGALVLFIPTLAIVLFLGLRDRRSKRDP